MANTVTMVRGAAKTCFTFTSNVAADDTVVVGAITYTFKATPAAAYDVDVAGTLAGSIDNLNAAIDRSGTPGATTYHTDTVAHPDFTATNTDTTLLLTPRLAGAWVNGVYLAATSPGANDIAVAATTYGAVTGTDGSGSVDDFLDSLLDLNQINSEVLTELHKLTDAVD